ncbi:MAG: (d)CMP kinase [Rhodospirillaceae bacterium]|jgi:CMP/dCMP kinase|nr:(d)CMP kinase [Rhodospirillaceae bacterium]
MIIAVDGPAASGKGTLTRKLAEHFNLARLDTGMIYRAVGLKALEIGDPADENVAVEAARSLAFDDLDQAGLRDEAAGKAASQVAAIPAVRDILLKFQRNFATNPPNNKNGPVNGAVLDGRDIGTVVCPDAPYKLFISASSEVRAERRYKELQERGEEAIRSAILRDIIDRDERDRSRTVAPLEPATDAEIIDTSDMDADAVFAAALNFISSQS